MVGWILQWNAYEPGEVGTVKVADLLVLKGLEPNEPSLAVTVCGSRSRLTRVRVDPAAAVIAGNLYPCTTTCWSEVALVAEEPPEVAAVLTPTEPVEPVVELSPQDVRKSATPAAREIAR